MTQFEFDQLPGLLTRAQFLAATGINHAKLVDYVAGGMVTPHKAARKKGCKTSYARYFKREAASIGGFQMK